MKKLQSIGQIIIKFNPLEDKYISREFQAYGIYLAEQLHDYSHRAIYIKFAKTIPRSILEKALNFAKDSNVSYKAKLFMWKVAKLRRGDES
jgi:hypothetical protein